MNPILEVARRRYTAKHYDAKKPLTDEELRDLLEILRLAPSSVNIQPWHFYVARTPEARARLMPAVKDFNLERVREAPVIIVFAVERDLAARLDEVNAQETKDGRFDAAAVASGFDKVVMEVRKTGVAAYCAGPDKGGAWAAEQAHIALGFLLLAAGAMGVDATTLGGMWFDKLDEILGLPEQGRRAVMACALGHRAADDANAVRPKSRLPFEKVVTFL